MKRRSTAGPKIRNKNNRAKTTEGKPFFFQLDPSKCIGCSVCVEACENQVLELKDGQPVAMQQEKCQGCGVCMALCSQEAILITERKEDAG